MEPGTAAYGTHRLARNLLKKLPARGNLAYSPLGFQVVFQCLFEASAKDTRRALGELLGAEASTRDVARLVDALLAEPLETKIALCAGVWAQRGYPIESEFLESIAPLLSDGVTAVDFDNAPDEAIAAINDWIAERTRGLVGPMVEEIERYTRAIVVSAVYFKARWATPFEYVLPGEFHRFDGSVVEAAMMTMDLRYRGAIETEAGWMVELPYERCPISMFLFLPADRGPGALSAMEKRFPGDWPAERTPVQLRMPRFEVAAETEFDEDTWPGILGASSDYSRASAEAGFHVSGMAQRALVSVDQEGTEAAAATVAEMVSLIEAVEPLPPVVLDRPFAFTIMDRDSGALLFAGRVEDPTV